MTNWSCLMERVRKWHRPLTRVNTQFTAVRALSINFEVVTYQWYGILAADESG